MEKLINRRNIINILYAGRHITNKIKGKARRNLANLTPTQSRKKLKKKPSETTVHRRLVTHKRTTTTIPYQQAVAGKLSA